VLPTLVYELEYPRSEDINWYYVAEKTAAVFGVLAVMNLISQAFIYPVVSQLSRTAVLSFASVPKFISLSTISGNFLVSNISERSELTPTSWGIGSQNNRDEGRGHATSGAFGGIPLDSQRSNLPFHDGIHDGEYNLQNPIFSTY
jgi:hypothetical protein